MSTTAEQLRGLVETIYLRTADGQIEWRIGTDKGMVLTGIGGYGVELNEEPSADTFQNDIRYTVFDSSGDQVDTFTDQTLSQYSPVHVQMQNYYQVMSTTYELARRQASGADKAIQSILGALGGQPISDRTQKHRTGFADDLDDDVPF